jgi:hypothetical protein
MRFISYIVALSAVVFLNTTAPTQAQISSSALPLDRDGWTIFTPSASARTIYVSSSRGSDSNTGRSPDSPLATIAKGLTRLRNGSDDELLLKAGDTFHESIYWPNVSGASASNPIVVSSYGTGAKPIIDSGNQNGLNIMGGGGITNISNIAIVGLDFYAGARNPNSSEFVSGATNNPTGISDLITGSNILLENDTVRYYGTNIVLQAPLNNVALRRNVVIDAYSTTSAHSQGLYADEITGLLLDGNVFDHNGWNSLVPGAEATIFNHNIYIQYSCRRVTLISNISAEASSHGAQVRPGGTITDNLFIRNPIGLLIGSEASAKNEDKLISIVNNNTIVQGNDIPAKEVLPRGFGIDVNPSAGPVRIMGNIIAHKASGSAQGHGIALSSGTIGVTVTNNVIYKWDNPIVDRGRDNITSPNAVNFAGFPDSNRTVEIYNAALGGESTLVDFLAQARKQSKANWRKQYTAETINSYIRVGFGLR